MAHSRQIADVLSSIDQNRALIIETVQELVRIPTVNPKFEQGSTINCEPQAQAHVETILSSLGMKTELSDVFVDRPNVVGVLDGGSERSLVFNGHIDVVPTGDLSAWTYDPFAAQVRGNRMFGRGTYDMKGGLGAAICAVRAIVDCGITLDGRVEIHSVVDEEAGGFGTKHAVAQGHSGSAVIVAEPSQGEILVCQPGLEWVRVTIRGKNAHAGWRYNDIYPQGDRPNQPVPGVNAVELAARFILAVSDLERQWGLRKFHPLLPPGITTVSPSVVHAGSGLGGDGLPVTVTNPAITPDVAVVDFDFKYLPSEGRAEIQREFEAFVHHWSMQHPWLRENPPQVQWELGGLHFPAFDTAIDHPLVASMLATNSSLGRPDAPTGFPAVADAAFYVDSGASPVIFGPVGGEAHGADEWIDLDSLIDVTKVMAVAAIEYCGIAH